MKQCILMLSVFVLLSCKTTQKMVTRVDSIYNNTEHFFYDSVFTEHYRDTYVMHDTIHITDSVITFKIIQNTSKDTFYSVSCDTIFLTNKAEKKHDGVPWIYAGVFLVIIIIVGIFIMYLKFR